MDYKPVQCLDIVYVVEVMTPDNFASMTKTNIRQDTDIFDLGGIVSLV